MFCGVRLLYFTQHHDMPRIANPKLMDFPKGLVYIYRSPELYGGETAARNNTDEYHLSSRTISVKLFYFLGVVVQY